MVKSDKIIRWAAFYFSVVLYFLLLPIVLSYSLGYNIDYKALKVYKTGLISLKTQPQGALVYLNGNLLPNPTPTSIEELKPGEYNVEIKKEDYYPWQKNLVVRPNMVTKAEDIVLFPLEQAPSKIGDLDILHSIISENNYIYYMTESGLFRSNMDGTGLKRLARYADWPKRIKGTLLSPDALKLLYFDDYHIWVIYLKPDVQAKNGEAATVEEVVKSPYPILAGFWYSQSSHIVFVADKNINVIELSGQGERNIVTLYKFNSEPKGLFYDVGADSLYFVDSATSRASKRGTFLHRLDLRQNFFDKFMQKFKKEFDIRYEAR